MPLKKQLLLIESSIYKDVLSGSEKSIIISLSMYFENISKYPLIKTIQRNITDTTSGKKHYIGNLNCSKCLLIRDTNFNALIGDIRTTIAEFLHGVLTQSLTSKLVSVPHHGAEHNWAVNNNFFKNDINWVVSYGKNNTYRHPYNPLASLFGIHYLPIYYTKAVAPNVIETHKCLYYLRYKSRSTIHRFRTLIKNTLYHCND